MQVKQHTPSEFAQAMRSLLPPGRAWDWPQGGVGDTLLNGVSAELARMDIGAQVVLDDAIALHVPKTQSWRLVDYQDVADASQLGVAESLPRKAFSAGSHAGDRLWATPVPTFAVPLVVISQLRPFGAGSRCGDGLWGTRARYVLAVRYFHGVVDLAALKSALTAFKQAHAFLFLSDITKRGGKFSIL